MSKEWFNDLKDKITDASKKTSKNVNYLVAIKKNELEISKTEHEIGKIFKAIGEVVYNCRDTETDTSNVEILCKQIDTKKAYIRELEKRIELIKEQKRTEEFGVTENINVPKFITDDTSDEAIAVLKFCNECGSGNDIDAKVCKVCGKKLNK